MDIASLVKKATTPPKDGNLFEIAPDILQSIKTECKKNPDTIKEVFYYLSVDLCKRSGVVRLRSLDVIDCLLHRSKSFRELVCADIKQIATATGLLSDSSSGNSSNSSLNSSSKTGIETSHAEELVNKGKELIEIWDHLYGDRHPQLRAIARYFRESLRLQMPNIMVILSHHYRVKYLNVLSNSVPNVFIYRKMLFCMLQKVSKRSSTQNGI